MRNFFRLSITAVTTLLAAASAPAQTGGEEKFVVVKAAKVITVSGEELSPGMIVIADGKIRLVGQNLEYPDGATVIDARRETVMPGMIHPRTRFQLPAFNRGGVHGDIKAGDEVVPSQVEFEEFLQAGFTSVCYYPFGSGIAGVSSVMRTGGPETLRKLKDAAYLRVDMTNPGQDKATLRNALKKAQEEIDKVAKAKEEWDKKQKEKAEAEKKKQEEQQKKEGEAPKPGDKPQPKPEDKPQPKPEDKPPPKPKADASGATGAGDATASAADTGAVPPPEPKPGEPPKEGEKKDPEQFVPPTMDAKHQPLIDLIQGKTDVPLFIELDQAADYLHAEDVLKPHKQFPRTYMLGQRLPFRESDYDYTVKELGEKKTRIVMPPAVFYLPFSVEQVNLVADLTKAGCEVALAPWFDAPLEFARFRDRLADLVRAGLDRKDAIKGATLYAANAVGMGSRLGSIEKDKDADLAFFAGDPLNPLSKVSRVMIAGEIVWNAEEKK
ncbi:MAG: amidohydrolase family protein [Phycisphaerales bacterium]|nr:amidohydrolase family protein [Phycisphaerales bacterium]